MVLKASLSMQTDLVVKYDIKKRINVIFSMTFMQNILWNAKEFIHHGIMVI